MRKTRGAVGYKRPPKDHCWKKGQSGNPKGRPRGYRNFAAALAAILHETVSTRDGDDEREMTKLEAVTRQLVDKAMAGDARLMQQLCNEMHKGEAKAEKENTATSVTEADREVIEALFVRVRHAAAAN